MVDHAHRQPQHPSLDPIERVQITGVTVDGHRPIMPALGARTARHAAAAPGRLQQCDEFYGHTDFDPDALREKYRAERDKRLRADGNEQYVEVAGDFAHYVDDPYVGTGSSASR